MTEHSQETKIAILEAKVEHMMGHVTELTKRVRANEKVVAIVSAVGIGAGGIVGTTAFAPKAESAITAGEMIQKVREWKSEQERTSAEDSINNALGDFYLEDEYGSDGSTVKEELLQLSSDEDRQGS